MDRKLFFKLLAIGFMSLVLLIPLGLIQDQIRQRSELQNGVQQSIANSSAGAQTLVGPVLAIRFREQLEPEVTHDAKGQAISTPRFADHTLYLPPESLRLKGESQVETRHRGIYQARLFHLDLQADGSFNVPAHLGLDGKHNIVRAEAALVLGIADPRGVDNDPEVTIAGKTYHFATLKQKPAEGDAMTGERLTVELGAIAINEPTRFDYRFPLQLTGTERLAIAPTGEANTITLHSNWQHPSFGGRFLPREREVGADGFNARWEVSHLARNFANALAAGGPLPGYQPQYQAEVLEIAFIDPVNVYLQAERAVKYGILFIVLTFAGFFLTEILRKAPIHPMQYLLVGLALALFFLLLIALSEHMPFVAAYGIAAAACIVLIGVYLSGALGGMRAGMSFGAGLTGLYGVLYGVLLSEDNSLLMGSALLFIALAVTMLATRRIDWYRVGSMVTPRAAERSGVTS